MCGGEPVEYFVDSLTDLIDLPHIDVNTMFQVTVDFENDPIKSIPSDALKDIRDNILDLKIKVRSNELQRTEIKQQDLHAINYITEFEKFLQQRQLTEQQKVSVLSRGTDTLKTVMANHSEVLE